MRLRQYHTSNMSNTPSLSHANEHDIRVHSAMSIHSRHHRSILHINLPSSNPSLGIRTLSLPLPRETELTTADPIDGRTE
jgi:hypothetical protein